MNKNKSWLNPKLEAKETDRYGKGVFAKQAINKGERLAIFGGEVMLIDEIKNLPKELQDYPLQIEERFVLGISRTALAAEDTDYFNHSCEPNAGIKGQLFLVAMCNIEKNEEVTFDYAMTISESVGSDIVFEIECKCGKPNCRQKVTESDWKLPQLRKKYKGYYSQYLQDKIDAEALEPA